MREPPPPSPPRPGRRHNSLPGRARLLLEPLRQVCAASRLETFGQDCTWIGTSILAALCASLLVFIAGHVVSATAHLVPSGSRAPWRRLGGILLQKLQTERARTLPPGRFPRDPRRLQLLQHSGRLIRHGQLGRELFRCDERLALNLFEGIQIAQRHDRALRHQVWEGREPLPLPPPAWLHRFSTRAPGLRASGRRPILCHGSVACAA
jgi:hypothetical protein